jgi:hypothetical protein
MYTYRIAWKPMAGFSFEHLLKNCDSPWFGEKVLSSEKLVTAQEQFNMHSRDGHRVVIEKDNGDSWVLSDSDLHKVFIVTLLK